MENEDLILNFMEISNLTFEEAKGFLERSQYDLELAIQNYYDRNNTSSATPVAVEEVEEEDIRPIIPREYDTLIQNETARDIQLSMVRTQFSSSFRDLKREMEIQEQLASGIIPKKKCLEDIYRHPVDITFNLDLQQAKLKGQKLGKWVAVLINNESLESLSFNRDIFNEESQRVKNILRKNFIFLRKNFDDLQALKILQIYNLLDCQTVPIFLIIDSITGELKKNFLDCTKLSLKEIYNELKKYSSSKDNQLVYSTDNVNFDSDDDLQTTLNFNMSSQPSTSSAHLKEKINGNKKNDPAAKTIDTDTDEESFASLNSNDISDVDEDDIEEAKIVDSDENNISTDDPQTNVLLRLENEIHKFKYPAKRTVSNLINYIYRNYLIQTGIYDNKTKRFSLISKIHDNKCLTTLDQEKTLEDSNIHPSIVLLHNTFDKD